MDYIQSQFRNAIATFVIAPWNVIFEIKLKIRNFRN